MGLWHWNQVEDFVALSEPLLEERAQGFPLEMERSDWVQCPMNPMFWCHLSSLVLVLFSNRFMIWKRSLRDRYYWSWSAWCAFGEGAARTSSPPTPMQEGPWGISTDHSPLTLQFYHKLNDSDSWIPQPRAHSRCLINVCYISSSYKMAAGRCCGEGFMLLLHLAL